MVDSKTNVFLLGILISPNTMKHLYSSWGLGSLYFVSNLLKLKPSIHHSFPLQVEKMGNPENIVLFPWDAKNRWEQIIL